MLPLVSVLLLIYQRDISHAFPPRRGDGVLRARDPETRSALPEQRADEVVRHDGVPSGWAVARHHAELKDSSEWPLSCSHHAAFERLEDHLAVRCIVTPPCGRPAFGEMLPSRRWSPGIARSRTIRALRHRQRHAFGNSATPTTDVVLAGMSSTSGETYGRRSSARGSS